MSFEISHMLEMEFVVVYASYAFERAFFSPKETIQHMRTIIPATRKDVDKATSCTLKDASTISNESRTKYIEKAKQTVEMTAAAVSPLKEKTP